MVSRAYGKALSDDEIEDVYSAAWAATLAALRKRGQDMSEPELRAYVLTAVASHASKELRRRSRKPVGTLDESVGQVVYDRHQLLPDERAIGSESQSVARDLLSSLPARRRAVMLLRYGWGLSPEEVCALVTGLSRRAYRKEVTRGVEQLIDRLSQVENGDWCRSREPMLRDYVAGTADAATRLQVEKHMSHCRACAELAANLGRQLNDLGGIVLVGAAAGFIAGVRAPMLDRLGGFVHGGRDAAGAIVEKGEMTAGALASSGGGRGAGAAGAGVLAKVAAFSGAGKAALVCVGASAAATACVAAGVVPGVPLDDLGISHQTAPKQATRSDLSADSPVPRPSAPTQPPPEPSTPTAEPTPQPTPPDQGGSGEDGASNDEETAVTPVGEFDAVAPQPQTTPPTETSSDDGGGTPPTNPAPPASGGGGGSIAGQEFGP